MSQGRTTNRRPIRENTGLVRLLLDRLDEEGVAWAPRFLRVDGDEEVLSWLRGETIDDWRSEPRRLVELARIVRQLHDLSTGMAPGHQCLVHDDLQPRNVVVDGDFLGLIDWEQLRPGSRVEDVAQLCWSFTGPLADESVAVVAWRWRRVLEGYGPIDRSEIVAASLAKIDRCIDDIVRHAHLGSVRHQVLKDRGDDSHLRHIRTWLGRHGAALTTRLQ